MKLATRGDLEDTGNLPSAYIHNYLLPMNHWTSLHSRLVGTIAKRPSLFTRDGSIPESDLEGSTLGGHWLYHYGACAGT